MKERKHPQFNYIVIGDHQAGRRIDKRCSTYKDAKIMQTKLENKGYKTRLFRLGKGG